MTDRAKVTATGTRQVKRCRQCGRALDPTVHWLERMAANNEGLFETPVDGLDFPDFVDFVERREETP